MRSTTTITSTSTMAITVITGMARRGTSLNHTAFMATLHCLTGCTIGEVLGMVIGTALGWTNWPTVALAVALAFLFGYGMTLWPLRRAGMAWGTALGLAFASDTLSMTTMELVDNAIMFVIPGAMDAGSPDPLFWGSLAGVVDPGGRRGVPCEPLVDHTGQRPRARACPSRRLSQ